MRKILTDYAVFAAAFLVDERDNWGLGMRATILAVGDGALGFRKVLRDTFPQTKEQRCWFHKQANALATLPSRKPARRSSTTANVLLEFYHC